MAATVPDWAGGPWRPSLRALLTVLLLTACAPGSLIGTGEPVTGDWGGDHIALSLTMAGGSVEYDCAHGGLFEPIRPDARGEFEAAGVHVREHGGPVREDEHADSIPARYTGTVRGSRMTVRVFAAADTLGPYQLERDDVARLLKCL
jgi:hypothetical protein